MKGQWIGSIIGDVEGSIIANIDDLGKNFSGVAFITPDDKRLPSSAVFFETPGKETDVSFEAAVTPIDPQNGLATDWNSIQERYPGIAHSTKADVNLHFRENELRFTARTDLETTVNSHIIKKPFSEDSGIVGEQKTWMQYKSYVSELLGHGDLFRGQRKSWKLRTAFHRKGRYDLYRFMNSDIPLLHRHLSARTSHVFDLQVPNENGAFLNLAQHHGYPTPLLDWTRSPYVAAFFAFRGVPKNTDNDEFVRIYIFHQALWKKHWGQLVSLHVAGLHLSVIEFLAIENERLIPQQAATTITNIDDIESYVREKEEKKSCTYLTAIDIPVSERNSVMQELSFMGITAGSMFPGLDGACEELREKMFRE